MTKQEVNVTKMGFCKIEGRKQYIDYYQMENGLHK